MAPRKRQPAPPKKEEKEQDSDGEQQEAYLVCLTEQQRHAVTQPTQQSLQILAGPGSGKTRVLTSRAAWMIRQGHVQPDRLVLVTFTNKAAREMINRLNELIGPGRTNQLLIGTFHATCSRLLRRHGHRIGLKNSFTIADVDDVKKLLKDLIARHYISPPGKEPIKADSALTEISKAKSKNMFAEDYQNSLTPKCSEWKRRIATLYEHYETAMKRNSALDFDDLLLYGVRLLKQYPDVVQDVEHVLVDEFQDTNTIQYQLMELLAQSCRSVTTVGDPDQSIYGWRSAEVANLQKMVKSFNGTKQVFLEENFRSTGNIVETALKVVQQDSARVDKKLFTSHPSGVPVVVKPCRAPEAEAAFVVSEIKRVIAHSGDMLNYDDFVILLRYNALSRVIEAELQKEGVPHRLMGGVKFFDRMEVKDILAYLCLADNPAYQPAFDRIVNVPKRSIGEKALADILQAASKADMSPGALAIYISEHAGKKSSTDSPGHALTPRLRNSLIELGNALVKIREWDAQGIPVSTIIQQLLKMIDYEKHIAKTQDKDSRMENIKELINFAVGVEQQSPVNSQAQQLGYEPVAEDDFESKIEVKDEDGTLVQDPAPRETASKKRKVAAKKGKGTTSKDAIVIEDDDSDQEAGLEAAVTKRAKIEHDAAAAATEVGAADSVDANAKTALRIFLEASTMSTDMEVQEEGQPKPRVTISTCHAAKGLEWPVVFLCGVEDGILPFFRCTQPEEIAEERRLVYVAITRAETLLYMSWCMERRFGLDTKAARLSKFLAPLVSTKAGGEIAGNLKLDEQKKIKYSSSRPTIDRQCREVFAKMLKRPVASEATVKHTVATFNASITGTKVNDGSIDHCSDPSSSRSPFAGSSSFNSRYSSGSYSSGSFNKGSYNRYGSSGGSSGWGGYGGRGGFKSGFQSSGFRSYQTEAPSMSSMGLISRASRMPVVFDLGQPAVLEPEMQAGTTDGGSPSPGRPTPAQPPPGAPVGFQTARAAFGGSVPHVAAASHSQHTGRSTSGARSSHAIGANASSWASSSASLDPTTASSSSSRPRVKPAPRFTDEVRLQAGAEDIRSFLLPNGTAPRPAASLESFQSAAREASSLTALKDLLPDDHTTPHDFGTLSNSGADGDVALNGSDSIPSTRRLAAPSMMLTGRGRKKTLGMTRARRHDKPF